MLKKDISVVKHALLDGMSTKAVWDAFDRIKKFIEEAQNTSTNSAMVPCKYHSKGAICHRPINCGEVPCKLPAAQHQ